MDVGSGTCAWRCRRLRAAPGDRCRADVACEFLARAPIKSAALLWFGDTRLINTPVHAADERRVECSLAHEQLGVGGGLPGRRSYKGQPLGEPGSIFCLRAGLILTVRFCLRRRLEIYASSVLIGITLLNPHVSYSAAAPQGFEYALPTNPPPPTSHLPPPNLPTSKRWFLPFARYATSLTTLYSICSLVDATHASRD